MSFGCFQNLGPILFILLVVSLLGSGATASVVLIGSNFSLSFDDIESTFAPSIKGSGECGILYLAEPLDGCSPLLNEVIVGEGASSPFVLMIRGGCSFDDKVRVAQNAGFKAAVIFDDEYGGALVSMAGNSAGIKIPAVFVSRTSGEMLEKYAGLTNMEFWILSTVENSAWSIMAIAFISLLAMSAMLATCFFVHRHRMRQEQPRALHIREFHGMSRRLVKAMPSMTFTSVLEDNCTSRTCAICLEDYNVGEKLRLLPCCHKFHAFCVDSWLTTWRTFCPVCKRDARRTTGDPPASESSPLLSPVSTHSSALSSVHLSLASSSAIQIGPSFQSSTALSSPCSSRATSSAMHIAPSSFQSPSSSLANSLSDTHYTLQSLNTYRFSPAVSASRSSVDLRNAASSCRFRASHIGSPSMSHTQSLSSAPYMSQSPKTYSHSPAMSVSRSSVDIRNATSSHELNASHLVSPHSLGLPSLASPLNSRYASPCIPSSSNGSPIYIGSSSRQPFLLHCSDSATSISPFASAQSLPGC